MRPLIFISNKVSSNYDTALAKHGFKYTYVDYDLADGLLIPGGGDVSPCLSKTLPRQCKDVDIKLDMLELYLIKRFLTKNKPVLGICRGLQIINVFFGGTLSADAIGHNGACDTPINCRFFGPFEKLYQSGEGVVYCNHRQRINALGVDLKVCALAEDDTIEAVTCKNLIATQFHPERTFGKTEGGKIFDYFRTLFN